MSESICAIIHKAAATAAIASASSSTPAAISINVLDFDCPFKLKFSIVSDIASETLSTPSDIFSRTSFKLSTNLAIFKAIPPKPNAATIAAILIPSAFSSCFLITAAMLDTNPFTLSINDEESVISFRSVVTPPIASRPAITLLKNSLILAIAGSRFVAIVVIKFVAFDTALPIVSVSFKYLLNSVTLSPSFASSSSMSPP